jgi:hypothetical protein
VPMTRNIPFPASASFTDRLARRRRRGPLEVDAEGIATPAAQASVYGLYRLHVQPVLDGLDIPDI